VRRALLGLTLAVLVLASGAGAQPAGKVTRLGILSVGAAPTPEEMMRVPVWAPLKDLGWTYGQNLALEPRYAAGDVDKLPALAAELVQLKVNAILALSNQETLAAKKATSTIPIVMLAGFAPVESGLVASLGHPGGNVTGTSLTTASFGKYLELLKEAVPGLRRVAVLRDPTFTNLLVQKTFEAPARTLGVGVVMVDASRSDEVDAALTRITKERVGAVVVMPSGPLLVRLRDVNEFAVKHRLPTMYAARSLVEAGGFMSYGYAREELVKKAAWYIDKVLRGAKPADLPVGQPATLELVVNLKTAKAIGLTVPPSLLQRADRVIE
jgi:putative tryptophan/tyrosine transport system substrate-binding protein